MSRFPDPGRRNSLWTRSGRLREEARAELAFHIESEVDRLEAEGIPRDEARRRVLAEMGDVERLGRRLTTIAGRQWLRRWLAGQVRAAVQDIRLAVRSLARRPGLGATVILTLAVGIGGSATMLSVIDVVAWRPLPYPNQERLMRVAGTFPTGGLGPVPGPLLADWQRESSSFEALAGAMVESKDLEQRGGEPVRLRAGAVSVEYGPLTGLDVVVGRWLTEEDNVRGENPVAVLGHGLWQDRWAGDRSVVGRDIVLDGLRVTVVGVVSPDHVPPVAMNLEGVQLWIPLNQAAAAVQSHDNWFLRVMGLRRDGLDENAALAELQRLTDALVEGYGAERYEDGFSVQAEGLRENTVASGREPVRILMVAALLLMVVACANVSNLALLRSRERRLELGVRRSLGASRAALIRQLLVESMTLSGLGGLLGVALAGFGIALFRRFDPGDLPRVGDLALDGRFAAIAVIVVLMAGVLSGLLPALQLSSASSDRSDRTATADRAASRLRGALVAVEVALALTLLTGGTLLANSVHRMVQVDPGFEPEGVQVVHLQLARRYETREQRTEFFYQLTDAIRALPVVTSAGMGNGLPFGGGGAMGSVALEGPAPGDSPSYVRWQLVDHEFFATLGASVDEGRMLEADEVIRGANRVMVNQSFARAAWGFEQAVGRRLKVIRTGDEAPWLEVVGVIGDFRQGRLDRDVVPEIYVPLSQPPFVFPTMDFVVKSGVPPEALTSTLRETVWAIDPVQPVGWVETLEQRVRGSLARHRFYRALLGVFAVTALALAAAGIYGTVATSIGLRSREIGVRMALGASRGRVRREVTRHGLAWITLGILAGIALSVLGLRVTESLLFGVSTRDVGSYSLAVSCLVAIGAFAVLIPARRVSRISPADSLRSA